jgi:outer membrane protein OmpA-like peptidoglycan-associated protein
MKAKITFFVFIILTFFGAKAQDKKAQNFFDRGEEAYKQRDFSSATLFYQKAIERFPNYGLAYYKLGQIANAIRDIESAKNYYLKLLELEPENDAYVLAYIFLGNDLLKQANYADAKNYLEKALLKTRKDTRAYRQIESQIANCVAAIEILSNPFTIKPSPMSKVLNFKDKQYFPAFTADGQSIYFTARMNGGDEDIYIASKVNNQWTTPESLSEIIKTDFNEGTCTISADGKTMVFTSCEGRESLGSCDLFISRLTETGWSVPQNMGANVNSPFWDSQATLSSDGNVLVFSSDRYGGKGGKDLYVTRLGEMNEWTKATLMSGEINTQKDEVSPFLHANGSSLFFASNGHPGLGGFDLFLTNKDAKSFTKPLNLGYPINDGSDQFAMVISADGLQAFYSKETGDKINLYQFDLPKELKELINPTFFLKGHVKDAVTQKPLSASLQLIDLNTKEVVSTFTANASSGEYLAVLPFTGNFGLYVEHPEYFFKSLPFSFNSVDKISNKELEIALEKIDKEKIEVLNNIYFDEASWELKPESLVELSKLAELIWRNPTLKVEISGHTDNVGSPASNLILSEKRAQSVVNYLSNEGLNVYNLKAKGFGEQKPIDVNTSQEGRKKNRRIELRFY